MLAMMTLKKQLCRFENKVDSTIEKMMFLHKFWGFLLIFVGLPLIALTVVCFCTTILVLPFALLFGWA